MSNKIWLIFFSVIGIFGFLFLSYKLTSSPKNSLVPEVKKITPADYVKWSPDRKNILVEYSDLQCPACKSFHDILKQFESTQSADFPITQKITFVYRHFPLAQHQYADDAAYTAEAAGRQGKFYEMVDLLFQNQSSWSEAASTKEIFAGYAKELGLDLARFEKDRESKEIKNKVTEDYLSGERARIQGTPTFFLNGEKLDSIRSFEEFKQLLRSKT